VARIESCEAILQEFQAKSNLRPSPEAWRSAKALLILNQFKAGLLLGVQDGYGLIMVKDKGRWSIPVLINAGEASFGLQLGAKSVESIFIITDENTPRMLFKNRFNIGVDAKAVAGPKAAEAERNNEEIMKTPLLAYIKSVGLYAGATVKAGHISRNDQANFILYNTRYTLPELLYSDWVSPDAAPEVKPLMELVKKLSP
jgi:lipid-binding SYLF domain-containing protein